nr:NifU [Frankia alni]
MEEIRPMLRGDGGTPRSSPSSRGRSAGSAEVHLRLTGACGGCSSANATLTGVIEARLRQQLPEIGRVALVA